MITPRYGGSGTHQNKGGNPMTQPKFKRPQPKNFGQNNCGSHRNFGGSGIKGASSNNRPWDHSKDVNADFKGHVKSTSFDMDVKRERSSSDRN